VPGNPDVKARERLANEIKALRSIEHPNIVRILDADPNANWIVYELMSGGTLRDNHRRYKGDPIAAVDAISGLAEGVAKLHDKGLVHRDIKPANIFWGHDGRLVLGDFGLVFAQSGDRITNTDEKVGTTDWTPTWAIGHHRWDEVKPSFDVFALGKLLWALIAGDVFLRLHYFDRKEYDLTTRFPEDDRMVRINTLLSKCIVEHEADCLHDARALQQELEAIASVLVGPSRR